MSYDFIEKNYGDDWREASEACKKRDGYRCRECSAAGFKIGGTATLHACHIIPLSKGGTNNINNLITKCLKCHMKEKGHGHMKSNPNFKRQLKGQKKKFDF